MMAVPQSFPQPFTKPTRVNDVAGAIAGLDDGIKNQVMLALRWFDKADRETDPLDAFLKSWFALEVIGMPDTANVKPIVESLAEIYDISYEDARDMFQVGHIAGLRDDIVHDGAVRAIHQQLHSFVQAVFVDLLFHLTGQSSEKRADGVLKDSTFKHQDWRP